ncbi:MFS transporter, partial [Escherichia coli]|nr:MFS transporter [Escherichia coli]
VLLVLFIGYTSVYVDKYTIGISLVTVSQDLGFDPSQKGLILSAFFLGYTLFQIPMGYLNNRIGARPVLAVSIIIVGLFLVIF